MTRILVWNIQRFSNNKINYVRGHALPTREQMTLKLTNRIAIIDTIVRINPDIFIMIEPQSTRGIYGTPIEGVGAIGIVDIILALRQHDENWCLVPPLKLNTTIDLRRNQMGMESTYTEGAAVFYKSNVLDFTGPWIWPDRNLHIYPNDVVRAVAPTTQGVLPARYPGPWSTFLPQAHNYLAGRYLFEDQNQRPIDFTDWWHRMPWQTTFRERQNQQRDLNLISVHLNPTNVNSAKGAIRNIMDYVPGFEPVPQNSLSIITGDFNINANSRTAMRNLFRNTYTTPVEWALGPGQNTMLERIEEATPDNYIRPMVLDNAIICQPGMLMDIEEDDEMGDGPVQGQVVDIVNGIPPQLPTTMVATLADFMQSVAQPNPVLTRAQMLAQFRSANNYGHLGYYGGASDHLPFFFAV